MISGNTVYWVSHDIIYTLYRSFLGGTVSGIKNIPRAGPCIMASNHESHLDPPVVGCSLRRRVTFFARKTLWKPGIPAWWLNMIETIPVDRDGDSDTGAMKATLRTLKSGGLLTLFPEGTRSKDGKLQKPKPGIGFIAAKSQAKIVPCRIFNSHKVLSRDSKLPNLSSKVHVVYGKPLLPEDYDPGRAAGKQRFQQIAEKIMAEIAKLKKPVQPII
ncbi:MAG: lysophospholipid acyltransferase family protein [Verrucomicrobiota bacterium]